MEYISYIKEGEVTSKRADKGQITIGLAFIFHIFMYNIKLLLYDIKYSYLHDYSCVSYTLSVE